MLKIGIVTTHYALNYGAVLQAYALQKFLNNNGYECEIIDYRPNKAVYGRSIYRKSNTLKMLAVNMYTFFNSDIKRRHSEKVELFNDFIKKNIPLSNNKYYNEDDFKKLKEYDFFICGSDQIWNLNLMDDNIFFLPFKTLYPDSKFIAYAPSIAETLTANQMKEIGSRIGHFDYLSIRELESEKALSAIIDRKITTVVDPIFLLDEIEWGQITSLNTMKDEYIACYFLGIDQIAVDTVKKLRELTGYKVINMGFDLKGKLHSDIEMSNSSPAEFVSMIRNASFVCTNSFHATAFSILFNKPFLTIKHSTRNLRMDNLFRLMKISDRVISTDNDLSSITVDKIFHQTQYEQRLKQQIENSKQYLFEALSNM